MAREKVHVFEVGPRDGLQNEPRAVRYADKVWMVKGLASAGVRDLELGAFVREDKVPQMADSARLAKEFRRSPSRCWFLVPNRKGLERALEAGVKHVAVFTAATDSFAEKNIGMSVNESLREYAAVVEEARRHKIRVRGYVSTAFGCPFEGKVSPSKARKVINRLAELGVEQVSVGDTIGVATPGDVDRLIPGVLKDLGAARVAGHFHDTRGTALANSLRSIEHGVRTLDSSMGGLGGCPFAPGATGNLATEDLVYMLHGMGMRTGIDLDRLCQVSLGFSRRIRRPLSSRYLIARSRSITVE